MSQEQPHTYDPIGAFIEAVKADAALQGKLKRADNVDAVIAIAIDAGFMISNRSWAAGYLLRQKLAKWRV